MEISIRKKKERERRFFANSRPLAILSDEKRWKILAIHANAVPRDCASLSANS